MEEIIAKLKELEELMKGHEEIISCEVSKTCLGTSILVQGMENVPTLDGTTYTKQSSILRYVKETTIDGVKIHAHGTKEDMKNEVA